MIIKKLCCEYCNATDNLVSAFEHGDTSIVCPRCFKRVFGSQSHGKVKA